MAVQLTEPSFGTGSPSVCSRADMGGICEVGAPVPAPALTKVLHRARDIGHRSLKSSVAQLVEPADDLGDVVALDPSADLTPQHDDASGKPPGVFELGLAQVDLVYGKVRARRHRRPAMMKLGLAPLADEAEALGPRWGHQMRDTCWSAAVAAQGLRGDGRQEYPQGRQGLRLVYRPVGHEPPLEEDAPCRLGGRLGCRH